MINKTVDVYADNQLIENDLAFGKYTDYISVPESNYEKAVLYHNLFL